MAPENTTFPIHNPPKKYLYPETDGVYIHQAFPKMVYTKPAKGQHPNEANKIVKNPEELEAALAEGYETTPVLEAKKGR